MKRCSNGTRRNKKTGKCDPTKKRTTQTNVSTSKRKTRRSQTDKTPKTKGRTRTKTKGRSRTKTIKRSRTKTNTNTKRKSHTKTKTKRRSHTKTKRQSYKKTKTHTKTKRRSYTKTTKTKRRSYTKTKRKSLQRKKRCPNGSHRNKKTGNCDKKAYLNNDTRSFKDEETETKELRRAFKDEETETKELRRAFKDEETETKELWKAFKDIEDEFLLLEHPQSDSMDAMSISDEENEPEELIDLPTETENEKCYREYKFNRKLGSGVYGIVNHMCKKENELDCKYAIKVQRILNNDSRERINKELNLIKRLSNVGIGPKFISSWECDDKIYTVTEVWDGDLTGYFDGKYKGFDGKLCLKSAVDKLRNQINWFHNNGYVHGDIYPKNVLVKLDMNNVIIDVTLADFGLADLVRNYKNGDTPVSLQTLINYHKYNPNFYYFNDLQISDAEVIKNPMHLDEALLYYLETKVCLLEPSSPFIKGK